MAKSENEAYEEKMILNGTAKWEYVPKNQLSKVTILPGFLPFRSMND